MPAAKSAPEKIGCQETQTNKWKQIAQAAAGINDLQLIGAQVDDVSFEIDWNLEEPGNKNT